jgi:hypothetical protein|tara:strand:+ start:443 stop:961 length:519 start_codon:yes stop_codon:yes gene_type:complete
MQILKKTAYILLISMMLLSCSSFKKVDQRKMPDGAAAKARKNVEEGRGTSIASLLKKQGGGNFEFSSSNPLWRATLETLDFIPMSTVDYSGGMIISDWYNDETNQNKSLKISVRFLSNEITSTSLKIVVHQKTCSTSGNCKINLLSNSKIQSELNSVILRKAALLKKEKLEN